MARRIILSDDITGNESEDVQTYSFMLQDGKYYQIDLSDKSLTLLLKALRPIKERGREVSYLVAKAGQNGSSAAKDQTASIRVWARQNGWEVGERGRLPEDAVTAYNAAQAASAGE